jgi:CRISPR-associated protein Csb2
LQDEIRRECRNQGLPEPLEIEHLAKIPGPFHSIEYRRNRRQDIPRPGYAFRLRFEQPVSTPFSLGYGSHFGLGQFQPEK